MAARPADRDVSISTELSAAPANAPLRDAGAFVPTTPTRLLDTRDRTSGEYPSAGSAIDLYVRGSSPVPKTGVSAVVLNITVASPQAGGYLTVYPDETDRPVASNVNFVKGQTVANLVTVPLGADGMCAFTTDRRSSPTKLSMSPAITWTVFPRTPGHS